MFSYFDKNRRDLSIVLFLLYLHVNFHSIFASVEGAERWVESGAEVCQVQGFCKMCKAKVVARLSLNQY